MESSKQLANRFREVLLNGKWIANTNYQEQITSVAWQQATQKIEGLNSIADLTFHINYYVAGLNQVFAGGELTIRDQYSFDYPGVHSEKEWEELIQNFLRDAETFAQHVEQLSPHQLAAPFVDEKYGSYRRNIEGMIEHAYYHLGQIGLIKKLVLK